MPRPQHSGREPKAQRLTRNWDAEWVAARKEGSLRTLIEVLHAAAGQDPSAMAYLAMLYREGVADENGVVLIECNPRRWLGFVRRAAAAGNEDALLELANHLDSSRSAAVRQKAQHIYRDLARRGDTTAMLNIAATHLRRQRYKLAVRWFRKAASFDNGPAKIELAKAKYLGLGTGRRAAAGLAELVSIAAEDRADISPFDREECLIFVARALLDGWAVPRDYARACMHLRMAATLGSATANAMLHDLGCD